MPRRNPEGPVLEVSGTVCHLKPPLCSVERSWLTLTDFTFEEMCDVRMSCNLIMTITESCDTSRLCCEYARASNGILHFTIYLYGLYRACSQGVPISSAPIVPRIHRPGPTVSAVSLISLSFNPDDTEATNTVDLLQSSRDDNKVSLQGWLQFAVELQSVCATGSLSMQDSNTQPLQNSAMSDDVSDLR